MLRCSACGHQSPPGSSFCLNCGTALAAAPAQTPGPVAGLPITCNACHGENPPGMKFCRNCGAALLAGVAPVVAAGGAPMMPPPGPFATPAPMAKPNLMATSGPRVSVGGQSSTISCPRCGTSTPVGFAFCQQCGLHLNPVAPTDPGGQGRSGHPLADPGAGAGNSRANSPKLNVDPQGATLATDAPRAAAMLPPTAAARERPPSAPQAPVRASRPSSGVAWGTAVLVNRDGTDGQRFPLISDDTIIGRAGADIPFDEDRFLARQHARIERVSDGTIRVHPLDTTNGVFKKTDSSVELSDGVVVLVGREVLRFEKVAQEERAIHPLVRHGVALFGSPPREPWGRIMQLIPSGGQRDIRYLFAEEVVLGREEGDIVFRDDAFMSRRHAAITWDGRRALLTDLGSSNGTFVRISGPTVVKPGDHVRMGDQLLRIER